MKVSIYPSGLVAFTNWGNSEKVRAPSPKRKFCQSSVGNLYNFLRAGVENREGAEAASPGDRA
jgi:hypothetical protein